MIMNLLGAIFQAFIALRYSDAAFAYKRSPIARIINAGVSPVDYFTSRVLIRLNYCRLLDFYFL